MESTSTKQHEKMAENPAAPAEIPVAVQPLAQRIGQLIEGSKAAFNTCQELAEEFAAIEAEIEQSGNKDLQLQHSFRKVVSIAGGRGFKFYSPIIAIREKQARELAAGRAADEARAARLVLEMLQRGKGWCNTGYGPNGSRKRPY